MRYSVPSTISTDNPVRFRHILWKELNRRKVPATMVERDQINQSGPRLNFKSTVCHLALGLDRLLLAMPKVRLHLKLVYRSTHKVYLYFPLNCCLKSCLIYRRIPSPYQTKLQSHCRPGTWKEPLLYGHYPNSVVLCAMWPCPLYGKRSKCGLQLLNIPHIPCTKESDGRKALRQTWLLS